MALGLLIDVLVAWLLVKFTAPGWKRMLLGLLGGWIAAFAGSVVVGLAFGWTPIQMLGGLTTGLLVHPLIIAGFVWLLLKFTARGEAGGGRARTE